jgi:hypothetical protein
MDVNRSRQWKFFSARKSIQREKRRTLGTLRNPIEAVSAPQAFSGGRRVHGKSKLGIGFFLCEQFLCKFPRDGHHADQTHERSFLLLRKSNSLSIQSAQITGAQRSAFRAQINLRPYSLVFLCTLCIKILIPIHIRGAMLESAVHGESGKFSGRDVASNEAS